MLGGCWEGSSWQRLSGASAVPMPGDHGLVPSTPRGLPTTEAAHDGSAGHQHAVLPNNHVLNDGFIWKLPGERHVCGAEGTGERGAVVSLSLPQGLVPPRDALLPRFFQETGTFQGGGSPPSLPCAGGEASLHDALAAFAPPHHQRSHQQGDEDGQQDERAEDAVGGVVQRSARGRAVPEVLPVDGHEELVHQPVGPVAVEPLGDQRRAVRQLPVGAATQTRAQGWHQGRAPRHERATSPLHNIECYIFAIYGRTR